MVRRLGLLIVLIVSAVMAQRSDTIYQQLVTASSSVGVTVNVNNIGQSTHLIAVNFTNNSGTCSAPNLFGQLEYSYDNVLFAPFGTPQGRTELVSIDSNIYTATGAFPYVRFNIQGFDQTHCKITVNYSGTLSSSVVEAVGGAPIGVSGLSVSGIYAQAPIVIGGFGNIGNIAPIATCNLSQSIAATVGTTAYSAIGYGTSGIQTQKLYVCNLTATTAGTATLQLALSLDPGCLAKTAFSPAYNVISSAPLVIGNGLGAVLSYPFTNGNSAAYVCAIVTGATVNTSISLAILPNTEQ